MGIRTRERAKKKAKLSKIVDNGQGTKESCCSSCDEHSHDYDTSSKNNKIYDATSSQNTSSSYDVSKSQIVFVDDIGALKQIKEENVQLTVYRTTQSSSFAKVLSNQSFPVPSLPSFEGLVTPLDAYDRLKSYLCPPYPLRSKQTKALNDSAMKDFLLEIQQYVSIFSQISQSEVINVKIEIIEDNGCAFWHQDCVDYRLIKTYRGPCTQFVDPKYARETLTHYDRDSIHAQSFTQDDVMIFKGRGETYEEDEFLDQPGIVHRSPRMEEGSGISRLVLILDIPKEGWHY